MKDWIKSKQATLLALKYDFVYLQEYQNYLNGDDWCSPDWQEEEENGDFLSFEDWYEFIQEEEEFFNSQEYREEMARLAEKD